MVGLWWRCGGGDVWWVGGGGGGGDLWLRADRPCTVCINTWSVDDKIRSFIYRWIMVQTHRCVINIAGELGFSSFCETAYYVRCN